MKDSVNDFKVIRDASIINLGSICKINLSNCLKIDNIKMEMSLGYSQFNIGNKVMPCASHSYDPIIKDTRQGFGLFGEMPATKLLGINTHLGSYFKDVLTMQSLFSVTDDNDNYGHNVTAAGLELGMLDTIFLRTGYYNGISDRFTGGTTGFGVKGHFQEFLFLEYNYGRYTGGEIKNNRNNWDLNLTWKYKL